MFHGRYDKNMMWYPLVIPSVYVRPAGKTSVPLPPAARDFARAVAPSREGGPLEELLPGWRAEPSAIKEESKIVEKPATMPQVQNLKSYEQAVEIRIQKWLATLKKKPPSPG